MRAPHSKRVNKASKHSTASERPKGVQYADKYADAPYDRAAILAALEKNKFAKGNTAGGRKPPYKPEYAEIAKAMCARGATTYQLAEALGVSADTVSTWIVTQPAFSEACKINDEACDERVKRSVFESALVPNSGAAKSWLDRVMKEKSNKNLSDEEAMARARASLYDSFCGNSFRPVEHRAKTSKDLQIEGKVVDNSEPE